VFIPVGSFHRQSFNRHGAFPKTSTQFSRNPFRVSERETSTLTVHEILGGLTQPDYRQSLYPEAVGYWQRYLQRAKLYPSQTRFLVPTQVLLSQTQFVDWGTYRIAAQYTPLMTAGLFSCSALALQNPNNQTHLLIHPFPSSNLTEIQDILKKFITQNQSAQTLKPIQATIIPGLLEDANWSAQRLEEAVQSASQSTGIPVQTEWASFHPEESLLGVYSHMGKTLDMPALAHKNSIQPFIMHLKRKTLSAYEGSKTQIKQG
jgi:hypothetical protein